MEDKIKRFKNKIKEKKMLDSMLALLQWDLETQAPKGGYKLISEMIGELSLKSYNLTTSQEFYEILEELKKSINVLDDITRRELELLEEEIEKIKVIPSDEYKMYSELTAKAQGIWEIARENNDFASFAPILEQIFNFNRKFIEYRGEKQDVYSVILNDYEKGMNIEKLDFFFDELKKEIVPLLKEITKNKRDFQEKIKFQVSEVDQKNFSNEILKYIGFNLERGILSESAHPFTLTVNKDDVRLTTRYIKELPFSSVFSTIHEGGHGIYEQNIAEDLKETILSDGASMGVHESQSRFYENVIGRSKEFWYGLLEKSKFKYKELENLSLDEIYKGINEVSPSLIRVEADELTYSLHIMVRYEIEKGILSGEYLVKDLPNIWNKKMYEYLGVIPKSDSEGVLQDVHWSCGLIGYFPSYALGNVYSLQILNAMKKEINIEGVLERGELKKIKTWLEEKIHKYGKLKTPKEIMIEVTGEELNPVYYIDYLKEKYREIYN
ncbi:carboxypeptidase M32 [Cetobacterium somerae]|uniref:carboxypeptidase M32 n=1 Tax=Cetobacterium sp. NK01 TaxID=2993530 RepID=UPI002115D731|nr:carboxypeptidase M32 [Cetobacterium sp. NK01]MCQ8211668.1 carboxypeptidase M32 [Cetobacterium sp. NK01]